MLQVACLYMYARACTPYPEADVVKLMPQDAAKSMSGSASGDGSGADEEYAQVSPVIGTASLVSTAPEVARFGAAKERKLSLEAGIAAFNRWSVNCTLFFTNLKRGHICLQATEGRAATVMCCACQRQRGSDQK